jgi:catechol 2,3-dioxygenase-like lactoylglutathione lyase family enzyme
MSQTLMHGQILGGIVTTPDLAGSIADYQGRLGLSLVERGMLRADLAASWGCPDSAGAAIATLMPKSGAPCAIRLVEQDVPPGYRAVSSYGWAAYEITVQDVFGWPDHLSGSGFEIIGPPREIAGLPYFVAMQMLGRGQEMIYLNDVRMDMATTDLPKARSPTDHIFIVILATPDRSATVAWYAKHLCLDAGDTHTLNYTMINKAFGLPDGTQSVITMLQKGRMPIVEVDEYPASAVARPGSARRLPPGNALVTLAVDSLDALTLESIAPPLARPEMPYDGRRAMTVFGPAGERIELVEIAG